MLEQLLDQAGPEPETRGDREAQHRHVFEPIALDVYDLVHECTAGDRVTTVSDDGVGNARLIARAKLYVVEFTRRVARPDDDRATRKIFCVGYNFLKHLRKQGKEALVHKSGFQLERPLWVVSDRLDSIPKTLANTRATGPMASSCCDRLGAHTETS